MTHHGNRVTLIGTVLQTWSYGNDRGVWLQVRLPAFFPVRSDGPSNLANVILPEAVTSSQSILAGNELHITGFIHNADRETSLAAFAKGVKLPYYMKKVRVKQVVTEVLAVEWREHRDKEPAGQGQHIHAKFTRTGFGLDRVCGWVD
jgi:hypothetical protein